MGTKIPMMKKTRLDKTLKNSRLQHPFGSSRIKSLKSTSRKKLQQAEILLEEKAHEEFLRQALSIKVLENYWGESQRQAQHTTDELAHCQRQLLDVECQCQEVVEEPNSLRQELRLI